MFLRFFQRFGVAAIHVLLSNTLLNRCVVRVPSVDPKTWFTRSMLTMCVCFMAAEISVAQSNEGPKPFPEFEARRIKPPTSATQKRITIQIDPEQVAPKPIQSTEDVAADVPMVGICFGHQIIAQAMGGKVEKFGGGWAVGRQSYDWDGGAVALNAWHQDQVVERPDSATTLANNAFCAHAALVYGRNAFTVQPHPEFESDFIDGLVRHRGSGVVPDPLLEQATAQLDDPNDNTKLAAMVAKFFRERTVS